MSEIGHNSVSAQQLRQFIERFEALDEERRGILEDQKDVLAEAKATGFEPKIIREMVRLRRMDTEKRQEREALIEMYRAALGMA